MGAVIDLHPAPVNLRCECGSEWWSTRGICIDAASGSVFGYVSPLHCTSCGKPAP